MAPTLIFACWAVLLLGCDRRQQGATTAPTTQTTPASEVRIAAAADLKFALDELGAAFRPSTPASPSRPPTAPRATSSRSSPTTPRSTCSFRRIFTTRSACSSRARGRRARCSATPSGGSSVGCRRTPSSTWRSSGSAALADESVRKIAIANPQHAPYGRAAEAALRRGRVRPGEGPAGAGGERAQAAQFVQSGAADAGVVALSLAPSPAMRDKGATGKSRWIRTPGIEQGGVVLKWAKDPGAANDFRLFMASDEGKAVLQAYGFAAAPG